MDNLENTRRPEELWDHADCAKRQNPAIKKDQQGQTGWVEKRMGIEKADFHYGPAHTP